MVKNYFVLTTTHLSMLLLDVRLLKRIHQQEADHSGGLETRYLPGSYIAMSSRSAIT